MSRNFEINSKNDILYHRIYKKTHDEDSLLNYINLHFSDIDFKKTHGLLDDNLLTVSIASEYKKLSQYLLVFSNIEHVNKLGNTPETWEMMAMENGELTIIFQGKKEGGSEYVYYDFTTPCPDQCPE